MSLHKITKPRDGPSRRLYNDACGTAHALDLIGERWGMLVMRELMLGPKRFSDLKADLPGISANVLTQRLEGLEGAGILVRRRLPPPASAQVYELTPWGYEAEPIMQALGRWATRSPLHDPTMPLSSASLMLSFRAMFDPARAAGLSLRVGFQIRAERFLVTVADGRVDSRRAQDGDAPADVTLTLSDPPAAAAVIYGGVPLAAMEAQGALRLEGDREAFERFATLFPLPEKATAPARPAP